MSTRVSLLLLIAVGCGNSVSVPLTVMSRPRPAGLIATIEFGNDDAFRGMRAFVDEIKSGTQTELTAPAVTPKLAKMAGATSLDGLDATSPRFAVWFDDGAAKGFTFVGKFTDPSALRKNLGQATAAFKGNWAVVGDPAVVAKVQGYALDVFPQLGSVASPTITVDVPQLLRRYRKAIDDAHKQYVALAAAMPNTAQMSAMLDAYFSGALSMLEDSDLAVMVLAADKQLGEVDLLLVPRAKTRLATFASLQKPSAFVQLRQLPASPSMLIAAGRFDSGPYRQGLLDMMASIYPQVEGKAMVELLRQLMAASTGDFAFSGTFALGKGMEVFGVFPMVDAAAPLAAADKFIAWLGQGRTMTQMNVKTTMVAAKPTTISGITVRGYDTTFDFSTAPQEQREMMKAMMPSGMASRFAMIDKLGVVSMSTDPTATLTAGIAAASGKAAGFEASGVVAALLRAARIDKDSLAFVIDIGAVIGKSPFPFMISLRFENAQAHLRMVTSSASIKSLVQ